MTDDPHDGLPFAMDKDLQDLRREVAGLRQKPAGPKWPIVVPILVALASAGFAGWQAHEARQARRDAEAATQRTTRAWIVAKHIQFRPGPRPEIVIEFQNAGMLPAVNVWPAVLTQHDEVPSKPFPLAEFTSLRNKVASERPHEIGKITVGPGNSTFTQNPVLEKTLEYFKGSEPFYVVAHVTYNDVSGAAHTTTACFRRYRNTTEFRACGNGWNSAD